MKKETDFMHEREFAGDNYFGTTAAYALKKRSCVESFMPPEGAEGNLISCLKWCHFWKQEEENEKDLELLGFKKASIPRSTVGSASLCRQQIRSYIRCYLHKTSRSPAEL